MINAVICFLLNMVLSISIVLLNKAVYTYYGFPNITMTCIHFMCTTVGVVTCRLAGVFKVRPLPLKEMVPISLTFCGFVVLTNLSLQKNTVGTYQTIKCLTMPCIVAIQTVFYAKSFTWKVKCALVLIIIGAVLNSNFDLKFSLEGVIIALTGVVITAIYQVWVGEKQSEHRVSAIQLLYYQAPLSVLFVGTLAVIMEPVFSPQGLLRPWTTHTIVLVLATGACAFGVNLTIYWIIGNLSPLTYNIIGNVKFGLTIIGGYIFFEEVLQPLQIAGISCSLFGVVLYSHFLIKQKKHVNENGVHKPQSPTSTV